MARHANVYNNVLHPVPRPGNWKRPQIIEELEQNPARENIRIEF
jgi:hypothetical protein